GVATVDVFSLRRGRRGVAQDSFRGHTTLRPKELRGRRVPAQLQHQSTNQQSISPEDRSSDVVIVARVHQFPPKDAAVDGVEGGERSVGPNDQLPPAAGGDDDGRTVGSVLIERFPNLLPGQLIQRQDGGSGPGAREYNQQGAF